MRLRQGRRAADEDGVALITALLIMLLSTVVVAGILGLAIHTAQRSGLTRNRTAALNAAEAGIQAELSIISSGACPTAPAAETALPNQSLPTASYIIQTPISCTTNGGAVVAATGYVPNATNPVTSTTMVAHVNRSLGAPTSSGGYDFPDALFTDGALSDTGTLNLYGSGSSIPNITADTISIAGAGSELGGAVTGQVPPGASAGTNGTVTVSAAQIGGQVTGTTVSLTGPVSGMTLQGGVAATGALSLNTVTVNGTPTVNGTSYSTAGVYGGTYTHSGTISGSIAAGSPSLPLSRPLGKYTYSAGDIGTTLGVGTPVGTAVTGCPGSSPTSNFYSIAGTCTYNPTSTSGITVLVATGALTVDIPPTASASTSQLYVIDANGAGDSVTINGSGSTLPVFVFTDGSLKLDGSNGSILGQAAADSISVVGGTTMTFAPPAIAMPDIAFTSGVYTAPSLGGSNPYISTVSSEYQCPGTGAC